MRISETPGRLILSDIPKGPWLLGMTFVGTGAFVTSIPLWATEWRHFVLWERLAVLAIGVGHLAAGAYSVFRHSATRTELDRARNLGVQRVRRLWPIAVRAPARFTLDETRVVEIVRSVDGDGDAMFQLRLWLSGSRALWLQAQPAHGEARARETAARVRQFLGLSPSAQPNVD